MDIVRECFGSASLEVEDNLTLTSPPDPHRKASIILNIQVECCVSLHSLGGAENKTTSFPNPCRCYLHYLRSFYFLFYTHFQ